MTIDVFFSYSHADEDLQQELVRHLAILQRNQMIRAWHDRKIHPGQDWKHAVDENLESARVILLLISSSFLGSDYCFDLEMRRALERHHAREAVVIPVIVRACDWAGAPFAGIQALPKDAKPVMSWSDRDEAWANVAMGIRAVIEKLPNGPMEAAPTTPTRSRAGPNPFEYGASVPPERFSGRRAQIVDVKNRIGGVSAQCVSVVGLRRSGKSSLLRYVHERISEFCPPEQKPLVISLDLQAQRFHTPDGILEGLRRGIEGKTGTAPWKPNENDDAFAVSDGLEALRDQKVRLLVLLDEFERIAARLSQFQDWGEDWRSKASAGCLTLVIATQRPLMEVYTGCGLTSPFGNIFSTTTLGALLPEEWKALVHSGFNGTRTTLSEADLSFIDDLAGGLPFYVQMAAALLWQHGSRDRTIEAFRFQSEHRFHELWNDLTVVEQRALRNVVDAGRPDSGQEPVEMLIRHGLLRATGRLFSGFFTDFVRMQK